MEKITLTQETIDAIIGYKETLREQNYTTYTELITKTFFQDSNIIDVDYGLYMEYVNCSVSHPEMASDIPEDLSHYECYLIRINVAFAFDKDGNDLEITNREQIFK